MAINANMANIFEALHQIAAEKGISRERIEEIIENSILCAYRKQFGTTNNIKVVFNRDNNAITIESYKLVVKYPVNDGEEISFMQAVKINPKVSIGDSIVVQDDPFKVFNRIATQTAKQVIFQKIKEAEKNIIFDEFKKREGELINGFMQRRYNNVIYVDIGHSGVEGIFPRSEQSPIEFYKTGDRIKALIYRVENNTRGPRITLSRVQPEFVKKLFEMEIPEVYDEVVEIKQIEREAGLRTKVVVFSPDRDIDPVGACVGMKGSRIQAIVRELEGEKIDIIQYSSDKKELVSNALTPATVNEVVITRSGEVIAVIDNDQLKLAYGRDGHNVRLASRICGFNITVKTEEEYKDMLGSSEGAQFVTSQLFSAVEDDETPLNAIGIDEKFVALLEKGGIFSVEELLEKVGDKEYKGLMDIEGIGEKSAKKIWEIVLKNVDFEDVEYEDEE